MKCTQKIFQKNLIRRSAVFQWWSLREQTLLYLESDVRSLFEVITKFSKEMFELERILLNRLRLHLWLLYYFRLIIILKQILTFLRLVGCIITKSEVLLILFYKIQFIYTRICRYVVWWSSRRFQTSW